MYHALMSLITMYFVFLVLEIYSLSLTCMQLHGLLANGLMEMFKMFDFNDSLDSVILTNVSKYRTDQAIGFTRKSLNRKKKYHIVNHNILYFA